MLEKTEYAPITTFAASTMSTTVMSVIYDHNPFKTSAPIEQIIWRVVFPNKAVEIDAEEILDGGSASSEELEWHALHNENPDAFLEVIQRDLSGARLTLQRAQDEGPLSGDIKQLQVDVTKMEETLRKAIDLTQELRVEASALRLNDNKGSSGLKLTEDSMSVNSAPQFWLHTVYDWMIDQHEIEVKEWARPGALRPRSNRKYTTQLLNILDAAIEEFYENGDSDGPPKNIVIEQWMKTTFPEHEELLSQKVIEAMCKMMKPDES
jgi:hypothetical protein